MPPERSHAEASRLRARQSRIANGSGPPAAPANALPTRASRRSPRRYGASRAHVVAAVRGDIAVTRSRRPRPLDERCVGGTPYRRSRRAARGMRRCAGTTQTAPSRLVRRRRSRHRGSSDRWTVQRGLSARAPGRPVPTPATGRDAGRRRRTCRTHPRVDGHGGGRAAPDVREPGAPGRGHGLRRRRGRAGACDGRASSRRDDQASPLRPAGRPAGVAARLRGGGLRSCQGVRMRGPSAVIAIVNSKWAASEPSWE